ncbi:MAG TPA: type II toxin-antitoxin system HicB family antitoxin [Candidatus Methanoperedens sp.]|nr:type II toxin-antitoxin system HicB family antitoxin [Candidatus Methanoperedens sp.]
MLEIKSSFVTIELPSFHFDVCSLFAFLRYKYLSNRKTTDTNMAKVKMLTAVLHREEDMYVAECPEVGTFIQGKTIEEAVDNLKEATELYLGEFPMETQAKSIITTFEVSPVVEA